MIDVACQNAYQLVRNTSLLSKALTGMAISYLHAIDMLHLSYFPDNSSVEVVGNATLDGKLTHTLEGHNEKLNVSQLLPLEPSHLWTQRKSSLYQYIQQFQDMVKVIARERHVACE
ncbi:UNVERIFIED_CONTAM: hypothetical protein K2H54_052420 [Gekko kuhli]